MTDERNSRNVSAKPELIINRLLHAPRELVFRMFTEREHAIHWWGPKDFTVPFFEMDSRAGGEWRACLRSPDGKEYWQHGVVREVVEPELLVYTFVWEQPGSVESVVTVTFADDNGKTRLAFHQAPFKNDDDRDSHEGGWTECFDRLESYLATQ